MKKSIILSLVMGASALFATAQTDFRHISYEEALKVAKQENKLVFVDFFATWCGPCKKMTAEVFPQPKVGEYMNKNFVTIKVDVDNEGKALSQKYGITAMPTYIVVDPQENEMGRFSGYMESSDFLTKLQQALDPDQSPERIAERFKEGDRTPSLVNAYVLNIMQSGKEADGFKIIDEYFNSLSDAQRLNADNGFIFTRYTIDLNNDRAKYMTENRNRFAPEIKDEVNQRIKRLYNSEFIPYFSGYNYREGKFDQVAYDQLKNKIVELGWNDEYAKQFEFVEKRVAIADDAEYLAFIEQNYDTLDADRQSVLIFNLTRLVNPSTPELKNGISKFLRSRLSTLSPIAIQLAGRTLDSVEGK